MKYYLAIDFGTQSLRLMVINSSGVIQASLQLSLELPTHEVAGWAEQKPEYYWDRLVEGCQSLCKEEPLLMQKISGLGIATQRGTVISVDNYGRATRSAISWLDERRSIKVPDIVSYWRPILAVIGARKAVRNMQQEAEVNWIREHELDVWQKTDKFLLLSGYLNFKLVGSFVDSAGAQVGYFPFDYRRQKWAASWDWKWSALAVKPENLAKLYKVGDILGFVTEKAAHATGLPKGIPLVACGADKACEVLGAGCLEEDYACLSFGTSAAINVSSKRYLELSRFYPAFPAALPDQYNLEHLVLRGFWMITWFLNEFAKKEVEEASAQSISGQDFFEEKIATIPPGSDGLILQPYWGSGAGYPGKEARGAMIGFTSSHTKVHIYKAIIEGLIYSLKEGAERLENKLGQPFSVLRIVGGGSKSTQAMQMAADIFGLKSQRLEVHEATSLGVAVTVAVGLNDYKSFSTAVAGMVRVKDIFEPDTARVEAYRKMYNQVYKKMYRSLQPYYKSLEAR